MLIKKLFTLSLILTIINLSVTGQTYEWVKGMGGSQYDYGNGQIIDASDNIYSTGSFNGTVDFDPNTGVHNLTSALGDDAFISKLDANGNLIWAKNLGTGSDSKGIDISQDNEGNIYVLGSFKGTGDFNPNSNETNLTSTGTRPDLFITKLDTSGTLVWAKKIGSNLTDYANAIALDTSGGVYITGRYSGTIDLNPNSGVDTVSNSGTYGHFIAKWDKNGNFIWGQNVGQNLSGEEIKISVALSGDIYIASSFWGTADFDPSTNTTNLTAAGYYDIFIYKLNTNGNFVWAKSFGGGDLEIISDISTDASGNIYATGRFWGTTDFDPSSSIHNLTSMGGSDAFIAKLDINGNFLWVKRIGSTSDEREGAITVDPFNNVYVIGNFETTKSFLTKLDASGNFLNTQYFNNPMEYPNINVDVLGNVYITGSFTSGLNFTSSAGPVYLYGHGRSDIFILKLSQTITGIADISIPNNKFTVSVYPNPTSLELTIKAEEPIESISIFDTKGVFIKTVNNMDSPINVSMFSNGVYLLKIKTKTAEGYSSFIKK
ncbi:MAG: T9SS type A sorting domain-containing protein [Aureispira sp.]|nr:T9SS type A sorting domain-containing protein [Aureispira sp.]